MKNKNKLLLWAAILIVGFLAIYIYYTYNLPKDGLVVQPPAGASGNPSDSQSVQDQSGDEDPDKVMAPDFELKDLDGNSVRLSDYRGKIVVLNFWAVWCKYCVLEMPDFNELDKELEEAGDAIVLAVNVEESKKTVTGFLSSNKIDLKVLMDTDGGVRDIYGISGYPTTFVLNPDGSLYAYIPGATDKETLQALIDKIRRGEPLK